MKFVATLALLALGFTALAQPKAVAPELIGSSWINATKPPTIASRKGKVTILHFWTFACSNCHANLPAYDRLYQKYKPAGVEMIGIHTPELEIERDEQKVAEAIKKWKINYPVLIDTKGANWQAWRQNVWPTVYVIDQRGEIAYYWVGELAWKGAKGEEEIMRAVDQLLRAK